MDIPQLTGKADEVKAELKRLGLWLQHPPEWFWQFGVPAEPDRAAFFAWLQFIYLPGKLQHRGVPVIAPGARVFLKTVADSDHLLQLLIELDALG